MCGEALLSGALEPYFLLQARARILSGFHSVLISMAGVSLDLSVQLRVFFPLLHLPGKGDISHVYFLKKFARNNVSDHSHPEQTTEI